MPNPYNMQKEFGNFRLRDKREPYLAVARVILWRKSFLKKVLRKNESIWDFEIYATMRCSHYKEKLYVWNTKEFLPFHVYVKGKYSYGITCGRWGLGTPNLFEKHGVKCDFSKRGFMDYDKQEIEWSKVEKKLTFFEKLFMPLTDWKRFKSKVRPKIKKLKAKIDIKGRLIDVFKK